MASVKVEMPISCPSSVERIEVGDLGEERTRIASKWVKEYSVDDQTSNLSNMSVSTQR